MIPKGFYKFLLKLIGWKSEGELFPEQKVICLFAPHTSIWDFGIGFFHYRSKGGHLKVMIKQESFRFPQKYILRAMGGFPINRESPQQTVMSVVHAMEESTEPFVLVICPEGTRKPVRKWKTGYHTIAKATGAQIYIVWADYATRRIGHFKLPFELSGDARADTDRIQQIFEDMHLTAKFPEDFVTR